MPASIAFQRLFQLVVVAGSDLLYFEYSDYHLGNLLILEHSRQGNAHNVMLESMQLFLQEPLGSG